MVRTEAYYRTSDVLEGPIHQDFDAIRCDR